LVEKHPGYPQELMLWTDTQQDWYWYAESEDSPDKIHPVQPIRRPILHFFNSHVNTTKIILSTCRKFIAYSWLVSYSLFAIPYFIRWIYKFD
jgi:hypothetical protein